MISAIALLPPRGFWVGLLALAATSAPGLADQRFATRFEVFGFAGMKVLTLQNRVEESGEHYTVTTDYATKGLASMFVNLTTHAEARGRHNPSGSATTAAATARNVAVTSPTVRTARSTARRRRPCRSRFRWPRCAAP